MEPYNRDDLEKDLTQMVKAGLLELFIRDDGEWVYSVPEEIKALTEAEQADLLLRMYEMGEDD